MKTKSYSSNSSHFFKNTKNFIKSHENDSINTKDITNLNLSNSLSNGSGNKVNKISKIYDKDSIVLPSTQIPSLVGYSDSIIKLNDANVIFDTSNIKQQNVYPLTPINDAYLELYKSERNKFNSGRNLNDEFQTNKFTPDDSLLNCEEDLEIEQAREEIASMESENAEVNLRKSNNKISFDYNIIKPRAKINSNKYIQQKYYNDLDNNLMFEKRCLNSFYSNVMNNDENLDDDQSLNVTKEDNGSDGEPIIEYVNSTQSILEQYNPHTRTFFKCSIYSPSNRLYTVDEVNSTVSDPEMSSHLKFSNKNHDTTYLTNSILIPFTPSPKVKKVSNSRKI